MGAARPAGGLTPPKVRTRLSICRRKARFGSAADALAAARNAPFVLLPYACDRCDRFHLTSRTKGKQAAGPA